MKRIGTFCIITALICVTISLFGFTGTTHSSESKEITVSAAISLKNAFSEIAGLYESKYNVKCILNFGSSGDLMRQISGGAPVDVFASAAQKDMNELDKLKMVADNTRKDFAANSVVLVVPANIKTDIKSFEELNSENIKKIAVGNPKSVPAGRYAEEVFNFYKLLPSIKEKLVYTENVRQVLDYAARGEVDAGVVYATDAALRAKEVNLISTAPDASHKPVVYPIAAIKETKKQADAEAFISLVLSDEGQAILNKYGFKSVKK